MTIDEQLDTDHLRPLPNDVAVVYLDQCVLSRLLDKPDNAPWADAKSLLLGGLEKGRLICPASLEHLYETAAMSRDDAIVVDSMLRLLSGGWSLVAEPVLIAKQIAASLRRTPLRRADAYERIQLKPLSDDNMYEFLRNHKQALDRYNVQAYSTQNELQEICRNATQGGLDVLQALARLVNQSYTRRFISELAPSLSDGLPHLTVRQNAPNIPNEFSVITAVLIKHLGFELPELKMLDDLLRQSGVAHIPFYYAKICLEACHRWKQKNRDHGDQYDITRLSCALPYADVIITDGSAASAVRDTDLDRFFGVQVFSTRNPERANIVQALKSLVF